MPTIKKLYLNFIICSVTFLLLTPLLSSQDFNSNPEVLDFIEKMELKYNFDKEELTKLFNSGKYQEKVVRLMDKQPEGTMTWGEYKKRIVNKNRISEGRKFIQAHQQELKRAEDIYGVPVEVITGNSDRMKEIVTNIIKSYNLEMRIKSHYNLGSFIVS